MRRSAFLAGSACVVLPAAARAQYGPVLPQTNIGVNVPLSGPLEPYGRDLARGVQAAIDETNRYSASLTHVFGMRTFDDQNSGATATTNVLVARADPAMIGMIGNLTADVTVQTLAQYANSNFAVVVPTITADVVTARGYRNVFRLPTKDTTEGQLVARVLSETHGPQVSRAVTVDGEYGNEVAQGFVAQMQTRHRECGLITLPSDKFQPADAAKTIMDSKASYVFLAGKADRLGPVAEALRLGGYSGDFGLCDSFYTPDVITKYGKSLKGATVATSFPPLHRIPSMFQLMNDFEREVGSVSIFTAYGYAAAQLLIEASQRQNATTRFALLTALQRGDTYNLLVGQYAFNYQGDATLPNVYFYTIDKDGFTYTKSAVPNGYVV
jgi:ABC-type branched-subunit amino acid transport system substrate-binding protein